MEEKIIFNGRVYHSVSEMPPEVQINYERINNLFTDANQDGMPDFIQQGGLRGIKEVINFAKDFSTTNMRNGTFNPDQLVAIQISGSKITINGREFDGIDEMPPDMREAYERIVSNVDPGEFEIYDEPWRPIKRDKLFEPHDDESIQQPSQRPMDTNPIEEVSSKKLLVLLIAMAVVALFGIVLFLKTTTIF